MRAFKKAFKKLQARQNAHSQLEQELKRAGRTINHKAFKRPGSMKLKAG